MLEFAGLLMDENISSAQNVGEETLSQSVPPNHVSCFRSSFAGQHDPVVREGNVARTKQLLEGLFLAGCQIIQLYSSTP
jgi:hypothetical protein